MNKKNFLSIAFVSLLMTGSLIISSNGAFVKAETELTTPSKTRYTNGDAATYYSTISSSTTGETLRSALHTLNAAKQKYTPGYSGLWSYYSETDYYGTSFANKYIAYYRGTAASKGDMNKEHVWPKSHGGNLIEGDLHMTRPTLSSDNSDRGNDFYSEKSAGYDPASCGVEQYRGDAARIIMYGSIANLSLTLVEMDSHYSTNANRDNMMGNLDYLLEWNLKYPVSANEMKRNEGAEAVQGNRNPFIDHPEYGCKIWGNVSEKTKAICSGQVTPVDDDDGDPPVTPPQVDVEYEHGTETNPISVSQALNIYENVVKTSGNSSKELYIKAKVTNAGSIPDGKTYYKGLTISDGKNSLAINTINLNSGVTAPAVGDVVLVKGYMRTNSTSSTAELGTVNQVYVYMLANYGANESFPTEVIDPTTTTTFAFEETSLIVKVNATKALKTNAEDATQVTFTSSNTSIAVISTSPKTGAKVVKGVAVGQCIITATYNGKTASCTIIVNETGIDPNNPETEGCQNSIGSSSILISSLGILFTALLLVRRKKEV